MKNTTRLNKTHTGPSKQTRWAYMMQAIEPKSEALNKMFPGYHPQWVQMSQMMTIGPENFMYLRLLLGMTVEQCAAYLRVNVRSIRMWESGSSPVPFAEFELMRLVLESVSFKTSHPKWDGWFISSDGKLVSPQEKSHCFTPDDLKLLVQTYTEKAWLTCEVQRLKKELGEAVEENTRLRQMFLSQGVVDELHSLQDRMNSLIKQIATAQVIPFQAAEDAPMEKAA